MSQSDESNDKSSKSNGGFVLFSTEVEMYVEALRTFPIDQIGSKKFVFVWLRARFVNINNTIDSLEPTD